MKTSVALVAVYLAAIVAANLSIAAFGPVIAPINAFLLIGLDLVLRDELHDRFGREHLFLKMFTLIAAGGVISLLLNPAAYQIAIGSSVAFMLAAAADGVVYHSWRHKAWWARSNASNMAGAAVDSIVFPSIAFGFLDWRIVLGMFIAKTLGGAFWAWVVSVVLRRQRSLG